MLRETVEAFDRFLQEIGSRAKSRLDNSAGEIQAAELLALGQRLERLRQVTAPARLRSQGLSHALAASARPPRLQVMPQPSTVRAWPVVAMRAAASVAVALLLGYGAVAVSAASLPDSPLYPVKLFVEDVHVAVAPLDQKPRIYVEQAARRLEETEALIHIGRIPQAERTIEDATRRIASARAVAQQSSGQDQVQAAIGATSLRAKLAAEALTHVGGSPPPASLAEGPVSGLQQALPSNAPGPDSLAARGRSEALFPAPGAAGAGSSVLAPQSAGGFVPIGPANPAVGSVPDAAVGPRERTLGAPGAPEAAAGGLPSGFLPIQTESNRLASPTSTAVIVSAPVAPFESISPTDAATPTRTPTLTPTRAAGAPRPSAPTATRTPT